MGIAFVAVSEGHSEPDRAFEVHAASVLDSDAEWTEQQANPRGEAGRKEREALDGELVDFGLAEVVQTEGDDFVFAVVQWEAGSDGLLNRNQSGKG